MMRKRFTLIFAAILALCIGALIACGDKPEAPTPLDAPVLTLDGSVVSWEAVDHATGYEVYIDGDKSASVTETRYELGVTAFGIYEVRVRATTDESGYAASELSAAIKYVLDSKPDVPKQTLDAPVLTLDGSVVSWAAVAHATGYEVYIDGDKAATVAETRYELNITAAGRYEITARAVTAEDGYESSAESAAVVYTVTVATTEKLDAPVLSISGNAVTWTAVAHATGYEVYVNGDKAATVTVAEYVLDATEDGTYAVTVRAVSTDAGYTPSDLSAEVVYVLNSAAEPLDAPVPTADGDTVSWAAVDNAVAYAVYIDGERAAVVTVTSYTVAGIAAGGHDVAVMALADNTGKHCNSDLSAAVECVVAKVADRLALVRAPQKLEYIAGAAALDLTGLSAQIHYTNAEPENIELGLDDVVTDYDLSVAGRYEIEFEKDGVFGAAFRIYVNAPAAVSGRVVNLWTYSGDDGNNGTGVWTAPAAYDVTGDIGFTPVTAVTADGKTLTLTDGKAPVSELGMGETLVKLSDGAREEYVTVVVAYGIDGAGAWYSMAAALDGYYVLKNDIDFAAGGKQIGNAPLNMTWSNDAHTAATTVALDRSGVGDPEARGVAFTGTLDGAGYSVMNYELKKGGYSYNERYKGCGAAMFGYLGKSGRIRNIVLAGVTVRGMDYSSILVGYNEGRLENITVEYNCVVSNMYSHGAIISAYNYGVVKNVVSYISGGLRNGNAVALDLVRADGDYTGERAVNGYVCDYSDLTGILGDGWRYLDGHGTVYCNDTFRIIADSPDTWYVGIDNEVTVILANPAVVSGVYVHSWGGYSGAVSVTGSAARGNAVTFKLKIPSGATGGSLSVMFRFSDTGKYCCNVKPTIGAPYLNRIEDGTQGGFEAVVGSKINLSAVPLRLVFTDGSEQSGAPDGYVESTYDASKADVAQYVTFYKRTGDEYLYAVIKVTAREPQGEYVSEFIVEKKAGTARIELDANGAFDLDEYLSFTLKTNTGDARAVTAAEAGITVGAYKTGKRVVAFSYKNEIDYTAVGQIELELWQRVTTAAEFAAINDNLDGYYVLGADIDFGGKQYSIGCIPLSLDGGGNTVCDIKDGMGVGVAFVGKFDGAGHTLSGFKSDYALAFTPESFARTLFNYIGEGGEVYDFTVSGFDVKSTNFTAFIAGCNRGVVRGVTVTGGAIAANYGGAAAFAYANYGKIENCACGVAAFTKPDGSSSQTLAATAEGNGTVTNCTVGA